MEATENSAEIKQLSKMKEGQYFDRKSSRIEPKQIIKHLIAFANASGGKLVIGIEDDGTITGFNNPKAHSIEDFKHILNEGQKTPIPLSIETINVVNNKGESDVILVFDVEPSTHRVIEANDGQAYLRSKDNSILLKFEQRKLLEYDKGQRSFEDEIVRDSSLEDLDMDLLEKYKDHLNSHDSSIKEILKARNFINKDLNITNAGILLFGNNPTKYFPNARIRVIRYDGRAQKTGTSINIIKEVNIEGAIPLMITKAREVVNSQLREFQTLGDNGKFIKISEYPEFAWFEGIVNALTHRNYAMMGDHIRISIYDDRIEIFSPGALPNIVTIENIMNTRYSRNPRIARVLSEFGWVKELNEGVKRIFNEMEEFLLNKPIYHEPNNNSVQLTLENNIIQRNLRDIDQVKKLLTDELCQTLDKNELVAIKHIYNYKEITTKTLSQILGKSDTFSRKVLKSLENKGIIEWQGSSTRDPTQHYTLHITNNKD
ncbi:ATP-dependent DNA helicase RecG [Moraxella osloensis]|uniref:ATP-dependent DNA helicase RecG n=1 Tax=Faucicola osloensis TaxID=34062 RepID=A0A173MT61_FAUOS|nr:MULTISPECIES: ATP-binding protein [Moraxella]ATQ82470.1 ATP-dependent DNA helicase RecG [Moraxella osloensis]ATW84972.1 ATP-dependent DNA helicase RecG [Moraxella osloensis]OBX55328.1 ATP-dependent DNA helicase RecG [Moraxella osloensis]WNP27397.1 ATP-binding protein [Moraxella sp. DOX410]BAV10705.1 ATP-dependent DNA helicase RecG [Moraxella osloensis]